jgi:hypothetical protein
MSLERSEIKLPSFIIAGVQKAATSWLYGCLKEHPDIFIPPGKREVNFLGGPRFTENGWDWWAERFSQALPGQIIGDVSVDYIYSKAPPELTKKYLGQPKFIVILRNPVERLISAYFWNVRKSVIPNLEINEGIERALDLINSDRDDSCSQIYRNLIERGFYDEQIERYLCHHGLNQFYFINYDDIKTSPRQMVANVFRFLNVDADYIPKVLHYKPKKNTYIPALISMERSMKNSKLLTRSMDLINFGASVFIRKPRRPELNAENINKLNSIYQPHNEKLREILSEHQSLTRYPFVDNYSWADKLGKWNK